MNSTNNHTTARHSMAMSGSAVKARQLASSHYPLESLHSGYAVRRLGFIPFLGGPRLVMFKSMIPRENYLPF